MEKNWDRMVKEFGRDSAESMRTRFQTYLDFAQSEKTKRLIIAFEKVENDKKP